MQPDLYQPLLEILTAENKAFKQFLALLNHESEVLASDYTHEQIHDIASQKTAWHHDYAQLQTQRQRVLQALELQDSAEALQSLADNDPAFKSVLDDLLIRAEQAQILNEANGQLIQQYLSHHQHALNILQNLHTEQAPDTYDAQGKHSKGGTGRRTQTKA